MRRTDVGGNGKRYPVEVALTSGQFIGASSRRGWGARGALPALDLLSTHCLLCRIATRRWSKAVLVVIEFILLLGHQLEHLFQALADILKRIAVAHRSSSGVGSDTKMVWLKSWKDRVEAQIAPSARLGLVPCELE